MEYFAPIAQPSEQGAGLLVVSNLPWGKALGGQDEDALAIARRLAPRFQATTTRIRVYDL